MRLLAGSWGAAAVASVLAAACSSEPATEIVVTVDTDLRIPDEIDAVFIQVQGPSTEVQETTVALGGADATALPLSLGLVPGGSALGPVAITVRGQLAGRQVIQRVVRTRFVRDRSLLLRIRLVRRCTDAAVLCAAGRTCDGGSCRDEMIDPSELETFTGSTAMPELCNARDDDGDREIDEDFTFASDERNCGGCGIECQAGRLCEAGGCVDSPVVAISAGWTHTCALREAGGISCWGSNGYGELGDGTGLSASFPTSVVGIDDAIMISAGSGYTCAVRESGTVLCWGSGTGGELGTGEYVDRLLPAETLGLTDALQVTNGWFHACAARRGGAARCWGHNTFGELGNGLMEPMVPGPVDVVDLADVAEIEVGFQHTCARRMTGGVSCWGNGDRGQLGDGGTSAQARPSAVVGLIDAAQISLGASFSCAVRTGGEVVCWGSNDVGELGADPAMVPESASPVLVTGLPGAIAQVSAPTPHDIVTDPGYGHSACARSAAGAVYCWGENAVGQLGDGTTTDRFTPAPVMGFGPARQVSTGSSHACALIESSREVYCWGGNDNGQLGDGTTTTTSSPVRVNGL